MADLNEYTFEVGGITHTARLDDKDVQRFDAKPVAAKSAPAKPNKSRTVRNKAVEADSAND